MKIPKELKWERAGKTLGEGGQSQVYLVKDRTIPDSPFYALKALKEGKPVQAYKRFYTEIESIKKLNHPYIIKIIDHSKEDDKFHYYVMEYIEGAKTLGKLIESGENPFFGDPIKSIDLFIKIVEALVECENCKPPIIHRDLSLNNVLILPDHSIKIIDFGLCQIVGNETLTLVDEGVGTVNYMAPECESGADGMVGTYSDLYSAGKILWSAITGLRAFARENPVFNDKSMESIFPDIPKTWHIYHIFRNTIRKDWQERWTSAEYSLDTVKFVRSLMDSGYPPLEQLNRRCPICGYGNLETINILANSSNLLRGLFTAQCSYCGYCFIINLEKIHNSLKTRKLLQ